MTDDRSRTPVRIHGVDVGLETRCAHYHSDRDVVALRFACCEAFFPCHACHEAVTDHEAVPWPENRFDEPAVYCGVCRETLTAHDYLECADACPRCGAAFNPGCRAHRDVYFER